MAISKNIRDLERDKFIESGLVAGQPAVVVTNADGSSVGQPKLLSGRATADNLIKGAPGFVGTLNISPTGSVVAGVLTIYDSLTETGTVIYSTSLPVTSFTPFSVPLNVYTTTGLYVGFDATLANVQVTISYS